MYLLYELNMQTRQTCCIPLVTTVHDDIDALIKETQLEYHELGKGWIFVLATVKKKSFNATIGDVGILLSPWEKIYENEVWHI